MVRHSLMVGVCAGLLACSFCVPVWAASAEEVDDGASSSAPEEITLDETPDTTDADQWFTTDRETKDITANIASEKAAKEKAAQAAEDKAKARAARKAKKQGPRYVTLFSDNGYRYELDTKNLRWIPLPHSADEYIVDTWVKLTQENADSGKDGTYTYPAKYYLAHYYVRPKTRQIQFLSELEVTGGRPDNTVKGRGYRAANWEELTPDSIEDAIYEGTMSHVKKNKLSGTATHGHQTLMQQIGDALNIGL